MLIAPFIIHSFINNTKSNQMVTVQKTINNKVYIYRYQVYINHYDIIY